MYLNVNVYVVCSKCTMYVNLLPFCHQRLVAYSKFVFAGSAAIWVQ